MGKDEPYVIDLCDRVLGRKALRQHRFDFLRGDTERPLPVDAYYPDLSLVIEYRERQHFQAVTFWDRKPTISGVPRGQQRLMYDQRRRDVLPQHGITVVELCCIDFVCNGRKRLSRLCSKDEQVVRAKLAKWAKAC
jgi:hypothetical protein